MKNGVFWDVTPGGSCKNRRFGGSASFISVTRIGELRTTLAVTSNRSRLRRNAKWLLQEPHGVTSQKTQFSIACGVFDFHSTDGARGRHKTGFTDFLHTLLHSGAVHLLCSLDS
jgi:hypothetical protein